MTDFHWMTASRTRNSSSFHAPRRIFTLPARHCELNGPKRVSLSPLSGAGVTVAISLLPKPDEFTDLGPDKIDEIWQCLLPTKGNAQ